MLIIFLAFNSLSLESCINFCFVGARRLLSSIPWFGHQKGGCGSWGWVGVGTGGSRSSFPTSSTVPTGCKGDQSVFANGGANLLRPCSPHIAFPGSSHAPAAICCLPELRIFLPLLIRTNPAFYNCISEISSSLISLCWITQRCNCAEKKGIKMQNAFLVLFHVKSLLPSILLILQEGFCYFLPLFPHMHVSVFLHKENELGIQRE